MDSKQVNVVAGSKHKLKKRRKAMYLTLETEIIKEFTEDREQKTQVWPCVCRFQ
jgi:hypothetical protein